MMIPVLDVTDEVVMRPWEPSDVAALHAAMSDPAIVRWLDIGAPYTEADAAGFIAKAPVVWQRRGAAHFALAQRRGDSLLGYLGVLAVDGSMDTVEFVYWLVPGARGAGYATAALETCIDWVRSDLKPERMEVSMAAGNERSAAVAVACGFILEGVRQGAGRLDGAPVDELVYVLPDDPVPPAPDFERS